MYSGTTPIIIRQSACVNDFFLNKLVKNTTRIYIKFVNSIDPCLCSLGAGGGAINVVCCGHSKNRGLQNIGNMDGTKSRIIILQVSCMRGVWDSTRKFGLLQYRDDASLHQKSCRVCPVGYMSIIRIRSYIFYAGSLPDVFRYRQYGGQ